MAFADSSIGVGESLVGFAERMWLRVNTGHDTVSVVPNLA